MTNSTLMCHFVFFWAATVMAFKLRVFVSIDSDVIYSRVHRFSPIEGDIKKKKEKKKNEG